MIYDIDAGVGRFVDDISIRRTVNRDKSTFWATAVLNPKYAPEDGPSVVVASADSLGELMDALAREMPE